MAIKRFVDAHVHFWDLSHLRYDWLSPPFSDTGPNGNVSVIAHNYGVADYLSDLAGITVEGAVHIDAGARADQALLETEWLQKKADAEGLPSAIVAFTALNEAGAEALLAQHVAHKNVRGIRQILNWHPDANLTYTPRDLLKDDAFHAGYALLGKHNLSFDLQLYPNQMTDAAALAAKHPDIPVIINHLGMPVDRSPGGIGFWEQGMRQLAALPHVSVKISGLGFGDRNWSIDSTRDIVLKTIEIFGTDRAMFASDFPTDKLFANYKNQLAVFDELTSDLSETERDNLFAANALRIYRI
ncbi:MAG: amidohydrolase family protein [Asticcacaulis sp.]